MTHIHDPSDPSQQMASALVEFAERYGDDWVLLVREVLGADPDDFQSQILRDVQNGVRRISAVSGHGVGKTAVLAWCVVCMILTRFPMKTVCTAPTSDQLFDALYAEVVKWLTRLPGELQSCIVIQSESIFHKAAPKESFISFRTSRPESPEAMAGVHCDPGYVLIIGDEASGIHEIVYEAGFGSMSGHNATTLLAGNGVRATGYFYETHNSKKNLWKTYRISCEGHPRVSQDFMDQANAQWPGGENSDQYRVRVLGLFPKSDATTIIPRSLLDAAEYRDVAPLLVRPIWGLDCARGGGDLSALAKRRGNVTPEPVVVRDYSDTMSVVGWVKSEWDNTPVAMRPSDIFVDVIGIGAGVTDRLVELDLPVTGINVSETPPLDDGKFDRVRDELWWKGLAYFEARDCRFNDPETAQELAAVRKDFTSTGKQKAESKKAMKKRKIPSPNRADAWLLTLAGDNVAASGAGSSSSYKRSDWGKPLRRQIKGL